MRTGSTHYVLDEVPAGAAPRSVTVAAEEVSGRRAVRVELTDEITRFGRAGVDYVDMPTFMILPVEFTDGMITVDVLSRINRLAPPDARAFAGVAYRITSDTAQFEAVYLRPLNGRKADPPAPRDERAVQYFAYPDWKFDRLREAHPTSNPYEAGADIGPDEWIHLELRIAGQTVSVAVDGNPTLTVDRTKLPAVAGAVGLFVDIGTEAYFSNLTITPV